MVLKDFYSSLNVPEVDRIQQEKNILLVLPTKDFDIKPVLARMGVSKYEVVKTWKKESCGLVEEIAAANPKLVIQVDHKVSKRFYFIDSKETGPLDFQDKINAVLADQYVCLHHHDEFSIKDGLGTVTQLVDMLNKQRRSFCSVTNHGNIGGWIKQYSACKKAGVKALFGIEFYIGQYRGDDAELKKENRSANHLICLAKNKEGFDNIIRIHNDAQLNGFYYSPRANREAFEKWGKGIIGSSACFQGELTQALMAGDEVKAIEIYEFYKRTLDRFYVEIQIIEMEEQKEANRRLIQFARKVGAPILATCDCHYLDSENSTTHDLLMCIRQGKTIKDKIEKDDDVWTFNVKNLFYRNAEQMRKVFEQGWHEEDGTARAPFKDDVFTEEVFAEAIANTRNLALEVEDIKLDSTIKLPKIYDDSKEMLRSKINAGFKVRGLMEKPNNQVYLNRIKEEFDVLDKYGLCDYFLIVDKIISDAKEKYGEFATGYGRGSAAGSLVSYCLGITDVDPIHYDLSFSRFINIGRVEAGEYPDIDCDFDPRIRGWVKQRIVEVFGKDNVCSIATYSTYKTRAVILDVARALGESVEEAAIVTKKIEPLKGFDDGEGEETIVDKMDFDEVCEHYPELKAYFEIHPEVLHHARILRNQVKNSGMHAGGVIISNFDLKDRIPVMLGKKDDDGERMIVSAWAESGNVQELSAVGLVKFDILGLNNLPVISDCVKLIEKNRGDKLMRKDIPIDDREAILLGSKADMVGIFQFENPAVRPVVRAVGMESLADIGAVTSLIRPGPKDMGLDMEYANRKHSSNLPSTQPPVLVKLLEETFGILVYQEQCTKIAVELAGFNPVEADRLRKACGKKKADLMKSMKDKFVKGCQPKIVSKEVSAEDIEKIWGYIASTAGYSFNKSMDKDTEILMSDGSLKRIEDVQAGDKVWCDAGKDIVETEVVARHDHGNVLAYEFLFSDASKVVCTLDHKFLTKDGQIPIGRIAAENLELTGYENIEDPYSGIFDANNPYVGVENKKIVQSKIVGVRQVYDLEVRHPSHNFLLPSGIVTSNSHAISYGAVSAAELWLKFHYLIEYMTALINNTKRGKEKHGSTNILVDYCNYARRHGIEVLGPDINKSGGDFKIEDGKIRFSLGHILNVASAASLIEKFQPYTGMADFYERVKNEGNRRPNKEVVESLIAAGAFDQFGDRNDMIKEYYELRGKGGPPKPPRLKKDGTPAKVRVSKTPKKEEVMPQYTKEGWQTQEEEMTGLCLSKPILYKQYEAEIKKHGWRLVSDVSGTSKKIRVFGEILSVRTHVSQKGNSMYICEMTDGLDKMRFFVFAGGQQFFRDNYKAGTIGAVPMSKFDDEGGKEGMRFFDDNEECIVIKKEQTK